MMGAACSPSPRAATTSSASSRGAVDHHSTPSLPRTPRHLTHGLLLLLLLCECVGVFVLCTHHSLFFGGDGWMVGLTTLTHPHGSTGGLLLLGSSCWQGTGGLSLRMEESR